MRRHGVVMEVTEEYTTKTCGRCYRLHSDIGGAKTFICPHGCGYRADRDIHAARQILIKNSCLCTVHLLDNHIMAAVGRYPAEELTISQSIGSHIEAEGSATSASISPRSKRRRVNSPGMAGY